MRTPRFILLAVLLTSFALLGAECGNNEPDEDPLPKRAGAATPFMRTYYQTQTVPYQMRAIKIPEGPEFDDDELELNFVMGGNELVTDIDVGISVGGENEPQGYDLFCRLISPTGVKSTWKPVDLLNEKNHIPFDYEFDNLNSSGKWKLQLRDPYQDNDGRLRFRNATMRINDGESSTIRGLADNASETITLTSAQARFDVLSEVSAGAFKYDIGVFGVKRMLQNNFTFLTSFSVHSLTIQFALLADGSVPVDKDCLLLLMSPSGGYTMGPTEFFGSTTTPVDVGDKKRYTFSLVLPLNEDLFGEPSLGTWTLAFVDVSRDQKTIELDNSVLPSITLNGRTYT